MGDQLNEETHTAEILRQAGIDVPAPAPKKAEFKADAVDGDKDGLVQDGTTQERPVAQVKNPEQVQPAATESVVFAVAAVEPEVVSTPVAAAAPAKRNKSKKMGADFSSVPSELGSDVTVSLQRLVFENIYSQNSASVIAVQKRLIECGFITAGDDNLGYMTVGTREALQDFVKELAVEAVDDAGLVTEDVIKSLFLGTPVAVIA